MERKTAAGPVPGMSELEKRNAAIARRAAAEGMVLLENRNQVLPLKAGARIALYGGGALYTVKGGTGSGAVNNRYNVSIAQGLRDAGILLANEDWLADYEQRYQKARDAWIKEIYAKSEPGNFQSLYRAHATTPLAMPEGMEIERPDEETDTAVYVISRVSGEGADRKEIPGDYYLSGVEEQELTQIRSRFGKIIVILNVGGIVDTSFIDRFGIDALVLMCQAGQEGGHALADILTGAVTPSARLADTWAYNYADYPSSAAFSHNNGNIIEEKYTDGIYVGYRYFDSFDVKPRYRFGYGLSYTSFKTRTGVYRSENNKLIVTAAVRNTGTYPGKEVVFVYACCPGEIRHRPCYTLIGFTRTPLIAPGAEVRVEIECGLDMLEEYHAGMSRWQLEAGDYYIFAGAEADPGQMQPVCILRQNRLLATKEVSPICPLLDALSEIRPDEETVLRHRKAAASRFDDECPVYGLEEFFPNAGENDSVYPEASGSEVPDGEGTDPDIEAARIVSLLTTEQKALLCCGRLREGPAEFIGNAAVTVPGAAGETTAVLAEQFGIPNVILADGPAGLRLWQMYETDPADGHVYTMSAYEGLENRIFGKTFPHEGADRRYQFCTAFPVGMLLAQTFDTGLMQQVGEAVGAEMEAFGVSLWLAPGMNIHRNPLCGRNYEYYSEDPLVSGSMAAAITNGVQKNPRLGTTIKHYACNNQEENRMGVSSIVSERTLRELYLKGFEIAIRKSRPRAIMTSYNKINGVHTANSYDLCTEAARNEWGFDGIIMTDWTTTNRGNGSSAAKCVAAGNDLTMPGSQGDVQEIVDAVRRTGEQYLSEDALNACAKRMVKYLLSIK